MHPSSDQPLLQHWISCVHPSSLRVVQWNTLAQSLATRDSFPHVESPEITLSWEHRFEVQKRQLAAVQPDIMAFEELDRYEEWKAHLDATHDSVWFKKSSADSLDGTAVFWRRDILTAVAPPDVLRFGSTSQIAVIVHLAFGGVPLTVAAVHFKAKPEFADTRDRQAYELREHLVYGCTPRVQNLIVLGDFNDVPTSGCVARFQHTQSLGLLSAYACQPPSFTTFKVRTEPVARTIDYILHSPHLRVRALLQLPLIEELPETGLPSPQYGSDHLMLGVELEFTRTT